MLRNLIIITVSALCFQSFIHAQQLAPSEPLKIEIQHHIKGSGDECFFDKGLLYVPERNANRELSLNVYEAFTAEKTATYNPPPAFKKPGGFVIEDGYIFMHTDGKLSKLNIQSNEIVWETRYESSWMAQWDPVLLGEYIPAITGDMILLVSKSDGKAIARIKGKNLEEQVSMSGDILIYGDFKGVVSGYDIKSGKRLWAFDVGESAGFGSLTDENRLYLPSWDPRMYCIDRLSGKKIWELKLDQYKNGCGSGFTDCPVQIGPKLFGLQRQHGMFVIDKNTGVVLKNIEVGEDLSGEILRFGNKLLFCSLQHVYSFDVNTEKIEKLSSFPAGESFPDMIVDGNKLLVYFIGSHNTDPKAFLVQLN